MKVTIKKEALLNALQKVQAIVNPRSTLPILANVLVHAEDGHLFLSGTDLEVSVRAAIPAEVGKEGGITLNARLLIGIIRELSAPELELEINDDDLAVIRSGTSNFKIVGIPEDDFPPLPAFEEGTAYTIGQGVFRSMLQKTEYAASTDETRQVLNGVLLSFQVDKLLVVATDGRRLALAESEMEITEDIVADFVLPSKTANELIRTLGDEGELKIKATTKQIAFEFSGMLVVSRLIDGTYPNYRQVIPAHSEQRVALEREGLLSAVRRAVPMTIDVSKSVRLSFSENQVELTTESPQRGDSRETIAIKYDGPEIAVAFNPEYLMDPLRVLDSDEIFMEISDQMSPGVIKSNEPFLYVIMPMRIS